jgi:uncharacterized protein
MQTIIYFHGYNSSSRSRKAQELKQYFDVFAPDIPIDPVSASTVLFDFCSNVLKTHQSIVFVGTSLGGYWAHTMAQQFASSCVLINPSCTPAETLAKYKDCTLNEVQLAGYNPVVVDTNAQKTVILSVNDTVLDYHIAYELFKERQHCKIVLDYQENHRFENVEKIAAEIENLTVLNRNSRV